MRKSLVSAFPGVQFFPAGTTGNPQGYPSAVRGDRPRGQEGCPAMFDAGRTCPRVDAPLQLICLAANIGRGPA